MGLAFDPRLPIGDEVRRVAAECVDDALQHLATVRGASADVVDAAVHDARKRGKEARAAARLVRGDLGDGFRVFDALVRAAAHELSPIREACVLACATEALAAEAPRPLRDLQASRAAEEVAAVAAGDPRIDRACGHLAAARRLVDAWDVTGGMATVRDGLERTYRRGRRAWRDALVAPDDARLHAWRRQAKYLSYQLQMLETGAPHAVGPLVRRLDRLADALGEDHDLAGLVVRVLAEPEACGSARRRWRAIELARTRRARLQNQAMRAARPIWRERPRRFARRVQAEWLSTARA